MRHEKWVPFGKLTWHLPGGRAPKGNYSLSNLVFQVLLLLVSGRVCFRSMRAQKEKTWKFPLLKSSDGKPYDFALMFILSHTSRQRRTILGYLERQN